MKRVSVRFLNKKIRTFILILISVTPLLNFGQVTFTEVPIEKQLYARDSNDKGHVIFAGELSDLDPEFDTYTSIRFDIRRVDELGNITFYKSEEFNGLTYTNNSVSFNYSISIDARLSSFNFQMFGVIGNVDKLLYAVDDLVSGDVFVIQGQSNAEALVQPEETESVVPYQSNFIRVFGSGTKRSDKFFEVSDNHRKWYYGRGDYPSLGGAGSVGGIGQWGLIFARTIVDQDTIPVAIFNGATGGKEIEYFQKNYDNSVLGNEDALNSYERLLWRLEQTHLKDKVKAIIWSQGEADASLKTSTQEYMSMFQALINNWNTDFAGLLSNFYIFQTKSSCGTANSMLVKEAQRRLADGDIIKIIQTAGLNYINNCHFSVTDGYEKFASRLYAHVSADFYGGINNENIYTPTLSKIYLRGPTTLLLETSSQTLINNNIDIADFEINGGGSVSITGISIDPLDNGNILFELSGNLVSNPTLTYLGRGSGTANNSNNFIVNGGGIELVCFNEYPIDISLKTIWDGTKWNFNKPVETMDAEIDGPYPISEGSIVARNLQINSGQDINFDSGSNGKDSIVLYGNFILENNSSLKIGDTESFLMKNTSSNVTLKGSSTFVKKEKSAELNNNYAVTYWGSSVEGANLENVFANVDPNRIFEYRPLEVNSIYSGTYEKYKHWFIASGTMTPGRGYAVDGDLGFSYPRSSEIEFQGIPNYKDISIEINKSSSGSESYDKSNLLSNPYPAAIDVNALIDENLTVFNGTIYIWTHSQEYTSGEYINDYLTYNKLGAASSNIDDPYYMASGQGFMILTEESSASFSFRNEMMVSGKNDIFYKKKSKKSVQKLEKSRLWLSLSKENGPNKEILIGFDKNATKGIDNGYDGELLKNDGPLNFYSIIKKRKFAIQALDAGATKSKKIIALGYDTSQSGHFSIGISRLEGEIQKKKIYLIDREEKVIHDLILTDYTFQQKTKGEFDKRFSLSFEDIRSNMDHEIKPANLKVFMVENSLIFDSEEKVLSVRAYDIMGQLMVQGIPLNNELDLSSVVIQKRSILFLKILMEDGSLLEKKIFKLN